MYLSDAKRADDAKGTQKTMKRLVATAGLDKKTWLQYRKKGITGTDAGAIVGLNPYSSAFEVYNDKITDEVEEFDNESMRQGRDLEEYVARRFTEETGLRVRKANAIYQNAAHPFMLADFDRLIVGQAAGLECKTASAYSADKWADGKIPLHYQMQVQHYLAVSGYQKWYIAALIMGKEFVIREISRDEELIADLITIEERFWNENVQAKVVPAPDGSRAYSDMLAGRYHADREKSIPLFGMEEQLKRRDEIDELLQKLEKEKAQIDQSIKLKMEDACYADSEGHHISWVSSSQQRLDTKKLKEEEPDIYRKYAKSVECRRFMVKPVPAA